MTANEPSRVSRVHVLTDRHGSILAAAVTDVSVGSVAGADAPPQVSLIPSEGQVVHEISLASGVDGDALFNSLEQYEVQIDDVGAPALVPRTGA
jgi:hypothetical protein